MALIIFDYDGALADTLDDLLLFGQQACDLLGVNHVVSQHDLGKLEIMSFATYARACEVPEHLVDEFVQICLKNIAGKKTPPNIFNGIKEVVENLAVEHTLVVVTTNSNENVRAFLAHHGLDDCIKAVYGVDMPGSKAEKIVIAKERFMSGSKEQPVFMAGDALSDIRAAKEAGAISIAVTWGHQDLDHLLKGAPDFVAHTPYNIVSAIDQFLD